MLVIPMASSDKDFKEFMKTMHPEFKRQQNWSLACQIFERTDPKQPAVSSPAAPRAEQRAEPLQPSADAPPNDRLFLVTSSDFACSVLVQNGNIARIEPSDVTVSISYATYTCLSPLCHLFLLHSFFILFSFLLHSFFSFFLCLPFVYSSSTIYTLS